MEKQYKKPLNDDSEIFNDLMGEMCERSPYTILLVRMISFAIHEKLDFTERLESEEKSKTVSHPLPINNPNFPKLTINISEELIVRDSEIDDISYWFREVNNILSFYKKKRVELFKLAELYKSEARDPKTDEDAYIFREVRNILSFHESPAESTKLNEGDPEIDKVVYWFNEGHHLFSLYENNPREYSEIKELDSNKNEIVDWLLKGHEILSLYESPHMEDFEFNKSESEIDKIADWIHQEYSIPSFYHKKRKDCSELKGFVISKIVSISKEFANRLYEIGLKHSMNYHDMCTIYFFIKSGGESVNFNSKDSPLCNTFSRVNIQNTVGISKRDKFLLTVSNDIYDLLKEVFWVLVVINFASAKNFLQFYNEIIMKNSQNNKSKLSDKNYEEIRDYVFQETCFPEIYGVPYFKTDEDINIFFREHYCNLNALIKFIRFFKTKAKARVWRFSWIDNVVDKNISEQAQRKITGKNMIKGLLMTYKLKGKPNNVLGYMIRIVKNAVFSEIEKNHPFTLEMGDSIDLTEIDNNDDDELSKKKKKHYIGKQNYEESVQKGNYKEDNVEDFLCDISCSNRTLRRWKEEGLLSADLSNNLYDSSKISANLKWKLYQELVQIKKNKEDFQKHKREGYFTQNELIQQLITIRDKLLERNCFIPKSPVTLRKKLKVLIASGKIEIEKSNNTYYYAKEDIKIIALELIDLYEEVKKSVYS